MKRILLCLLLFILITPTIYAQEEVNELYAQSAVLMDADSGRILFEKNGFDPKAMASTTKIMTAILALELSQPKDIVKASKEAVTQPKVHLGMNENQEFYMEDLLYSLMLESHNDTAVAIAEHVGGSVKEFAKLMNEKAKSIGCENTYFITPNGLDASDDAGVHSTTGADLAMIMRYCILQSPKRQEYIKLTQTSTHSFVDVSQQSSYLCNNHNAFLQMMDGAITGKTGFTGDAGYCYVGALERDEKTYIVVLLACGWPNNKNYKWSDTKKLMEYGIANYTSQILAKMANVQRKIKPLHIINGQTKELWEKAVVDVKVKTEEKNMLLSKNDQIKVVYNIPEQLKAPVKAGTKIGSIQYFINNEVWHQESVFITETIDEINIQWCAKKIYNLYFNIIQTENVKINQCK